MKHISTRTLLVSLLHSGLLRDALNVQLGHRRKAGLFERYNDKESLDDDNLLGAISDAEALLACHAYLRRKRRLEWSAAAERRRRQEQAIAAADEGPLSGLRPAGFFWEDRSQLPHVGLSNDLPVFNEPDAVAKKLREEKRCFKTNSIVSEVGDWTLVDEDEDELEEPLSTWESMVAPDKTSRFSLPIDEEDEEGDSIVDDFSAIDYVPSVSHTRRSLAAMRRWSDPAWKEKWWKSRWGDKKPGLLSEKQKINTSRQRRTEMRVRKLNPDVLLASPEMAQLTLDEIAEAIRTYRLSKRKRSRSRRKFLDQRANDINSNYSASFDEDSNLPIPRDFFVQNDKAKMRAMQQKRSERAKMIYKKRLENDSFSRANGDKRGKKKYKFAAPDESLPAATSPKDALTKITASLDAYRFPSVRDVKLLLVPSKLAKRKEILVRILKDCFDLRGKCVPSIKRGRQEGDVKHVAMLFVTYCPIDVLGAFVLRKLEESQNDRDTGN